MLRVFVGNRKVQHENSALEAYPLCPDKAFPLFGVAAAAWSISDGAISQC
jgi:hypothetical protein